MSRNLDSPVQTQMAVSVFKTPLSADHYNNMKIERKFMRTRRVFVVTETGCVLGMDLDRSDNVHTVKRRLQIALNVSTEDSSLSFGDIVLKNDLSAVRNDSPLLLTRNLLHRSCSTPCLLPRRKDVQLRDQSGPIEILGQSSLIELMKPLVRDIVKAIKIGVDPIPVHGGLGGAYYFKNTIGESVAIVKPVDEEPFAPNNPKGFVGKSLGQPGVKGSVRVGETGYREVAAYLLDYDHFANVPPTALVKITHSIFNVNDKTLGEERVSKIASIQKFIPHDCDASDYGTSSFPVYGVHRIGILDIRILNTDRHGVNILVKKLDSDGMFGQVELIPIDHGLCLPECLEDPYFEWIHWPQASIPFSEDELKYIGNLDPEQDSNRLRMELPMVREACLRVLVLCTIFLKEAAAFGLCLAEIGEMMTREFHGGEEEPSELEGVCMEAKRLLITEREEVISPRGISEDEDFLFDIDCEETQADDSKASLNFGKMNYGIGRLSKLEESIEEEESDDKQKGPSFSPREKIPTMPKLTMSLMDAMLSDSRRNYSAAKPEYEGCLSNTSSGHKSANEEMHTSVNFVKLADMSEEEWASFLEKLTELLPPAFAKRRAVTLGQRQKLRLGTSCQF